MHLWHLSLIVGFKFNGNLKSFRMPLSVCQGHSLIFYHHGVIKSVSFASSNWVGLSGLCSIFYPLCCSDMLKIVPICLKSCHKIAYYTQAIAIISERSKPVCWNTECTEKVNWNRMAVHRPLNCNIGKMYLILPVYVSQTHYTKLNVAT